MFGGLPLLDLSADLIVLAAAVRERNTFLFLQYTFHLDIDVSDCIAIVKAFLANAATAACLTLQHTHICQFFNGLSGVMSSQ